MGYFFDVSFINPNNPPERLVLTLTGTDELSILFSILAGAKLSFMLLFFFISLGANEGTYEVSYKISSNPKYHLYSYHRNPFMYFNYL